jgi:hypothetical protein
VPVATIHRTDRGNGLRPSAAARNLEKTAHALRASTAFAQRIRDFDRFGAGYAGTQDAIAPRMAAVFALVFLFVLASGGLLVKTMLVGASFASVFALSTFLALASGVFVGLFKMARRWENEAPH